MRNFNMKHNPYLYLVIQSLIYLGGLGVISLVSIYFLISAQVHYESFWSCLQFHKLDGCFSVFLFAVLAGLGTASVLAIATHLPGRPKNESEADKNTNQE